MYIFIYTQYHIQYDPFAFSRAYVHLPDGVLSVGVSNTTTTNNNSNSGNINNSNNDNNTSSSNTSISNNKQ